MPTQPAVALRAAEGGRRAVPADVHAALRPRDRQHPLLQRLRPAAGSRRRRTPASSRCSRRRCSTDRPPTIYGDGEQTRDFTYVANVVDGVLRPATAPDASGEVINVATGGRISLNRLFDTMRAIVGSQVEPVYAAPRAGDVRDSQADITKARRSSATSRPCRSRTACAAPSSGTGPAAAKRRSRSANSGFHTGATPVANHRRHFSASRGRSLRPIATAADIRPPPGFCGRHAQIAIHLLTALSSARSADIASRGRRGGRLAFLPAGPRPAPATSLTVARPLIVQHER